jgi:hypothetical protein
MLRGGKTSWEKTMMVVVRKQEAMVNSYIPPWHASKVPRVPVNESKVKKKKKKKKGRKRI